MKLMKQKVDATSSTLFGSLNDFLRILVPLLFEIYTAENQITFIDECIDYQLEDVHPQKTILPYISLLHAIDYRKLSYITLLRAINCICHKLPVP